MDSRVTSLSCDKCRKVFKNKCALNSHKYYSHGDTVHSCMGCSYKTYNRYCLAKHIRTHIKDGIHVNCTGGRCKTCTRYTCTICKIQCLSPDSLATHLAIKHGVQTNETEVYKCSGCPYKTFVKKYMTDHIESHTKDMDCMCIVLEKEGIARHVNTIPAQYVKGNVCLQILWQDTCSSNMVYIQVKPKFTNVLDVHIKQLRSKV